MTNRSDLLKELRRAHKAFASSNLSEAESILLAMLDLGVERELILVEICQFYISSKQVEKTARYLEELLSIKPSNMACVLNLASGCVSAGMSESAVDMYRYALSLNENQPNCLFNLALQLRKIGEFEASAEAYRKAIELEIDGQEEVYNNLALVYVDMNRPDLAGKFFEKSLSIEPNYIPALFNLAGLAEERGDRACSRRLYRKILSLDSNYYPALSRLVYQSDIESEDDPIIGELKTALSSGIDSRLEREELLFSLGKALDDCAEYDAAFEAYHKANEVGRLRFRAYRKDLQEKYTQNLISIFDQAWADNLPQRSGFSPIFICGMLRSGSTLLERVLSGHSQVTAGGELDFIPQQVKKLGGAYFSQFKSGESGFFEATALAYENHVAKKFDVKGFFTDKRPDNFLHIGFIKSLFPQAKIVWTKRNLMDNCLSVYFQQLGAGMNYSVDLEWIGHYYRQQELLMEHWRRLLPGSVYCVDYDKFVCSPKDELEELLKFIGLDWEDSCLNFSAKKGVVKTASIWQVRKPLYKASSGRYRNYKDHLLGLQ
ncbi:tetratricopeptide repeat-containing sulfotransferase family protein [Microbulbifer sp. SSSA002]|uniref:tetratricopeptide repeat-containing sulfotransferase family protein n=1 Tax=unclassified Microbulbifer TaxID=2619833 RepID=UPI00403A5E2F